ncbi:MAG: tRNA preQ1(34) S-adenosylmethionine ribosyltransferase-isomerase QueA [Lachnospiraceae bacterium]|nr:tRNA preQ1(34) S-adenosylmethionine ribosyltransferase-isomerase QueA [Lachnospiraceae bacterium]
MTAGYSTDDYAYDLPQELIAQDPLTDRTASRLLVMDRRTGSVSHHVFSEIASFLREGDLLVLNDTKVLPVRLYGVKRDTGAKAELLLLKRRARDAANTHPDGQAPGTCAHTAACDWECLVRPGKKLPKGAVVTFREKEEARACLTAEILDVLEEGNRLVRFTWDAAPKRTFEEVLDTLGEMPLPPYITRPLADRERYNTVYARYDGSAAAPTAGLHFTEKLLGEVRAKGVNIAYVTLHVGLGTFRPVKARDVREHHMHSEWYNVPEETARLIDETKRAGGRVICVGTTSCRTLESAAGQYGFCPRSGPDARMTKASPCPAGSGETDIFIFPGYDFRVMDGLVTNFHLPESTLLMLVSAFAGRERVLAAYREAVRERYRFFSFGDAMLIL